MTIATPTENTTSGHDELVRLDPRFAPDHAAYYLAGLAEHTGTPHLPLSRAGFPAAYDDRQPLAFVLRRNGEERRIYIAARDEAGIDPAGLVWADVYGKINLRWEDVPAGHGHKVLPIGPSHGLQLWDVARALRMAVRTHLADGRIVGIKDHYRRYWVLARRRGTTDLYEPAPAEDRYVFYNSWLWKKHLDANPPRADFVRVCRRLDRAGVIDFEGGFIRRRRDDLPEYRDLVADRAYDLPAYLERIKRSAVVFNNPAVHGCHGWKLAEFLRLGKAIVSLPPRRALPEPLRHGDNVHLVDGSEAELEAAIRRIVDDPAYRRRLEAGARAYYLEHLAPARVIGRLADAAFSPASPAATADDTTRDVSAPSRAETRRR